MTAIRGLRGVACAAENWATVSKVRARTVSRDKEERRVFIADSFGGIWSYGARLMKAVNKGAEEKKGVGCKLNRVRVRCQGKSMECRGKGTGAGSWGRGTGNTEQGKWTERPVCSAGSTMLTLKTVPYSAEE